LPFEHLVSGHDAPKQRKVEYDPKFPEQDNVKERRRRKNTSTRGSIKCLLAS